MTPSDTSPTNSPLHSAAGASSSPGSALRDRIARFEQKGGVRNEDGECGRDDECRSDHKGLDALSLISPLAHPHKGVMLHPVRHGQLFVVISDARVARDLLVTRGSIISSRRQYFIKNKLILNGRAITGSPYDEKW